MEFVHVRAQRRSRADAVALARQYIAALSLLDTRAADLDLALTLFQRHSALGAFDSVLAALALNQRIEAVVSADPAFGTVPNLRWVDPATSGLDRLIGG